MLRKQWKFKLLEKYYLIMYDLLIYLMKLKISFDVRVEKIKEMSHCKT